MDEENGKSNIKAKEKELKESIENLYPGWIVNVVFNVVFPGKAEANGEDLEGLFEFIEGCLKDREDGKWEN